MKTGGVSLLVPVWNHERYLADLCRSLERQTRSPEEILFSDDDSRDGSARVVEAWAAGRPGIRLWRQKTNLGITGNSNFLLAQARADYVLTLHSDDRLGDVRAVEIMAGILERDPSIALVTGPRQMIDEQSRPIRIEGKLPPGRHCRRDILRRILMTEANPVGEPSAVMFRRSALPDGFDPSYRQLWDLRAWLELLGQGDLHALDRPVVEIREHADQATRRNARSGLHQAEHLRLFAGLLGEADQVLSRREKTVLLHRLSRTARRHPTGLPEEVAARLRQAKAAMPPWAYAWHLCGHHLSKLKKNFVPAFSGHRVPDPT